MEGRSTVTPLLTALTIAVFALHFVGRGGRSLPALICDQHRSWQLDNLWLADCNVVGRSLGYVIRNLCVRVLFEPV
jgi:hypothetical protein